MIYESKNCTSDLNFLKSRNIVLKKIDIFPYVLFGLIISYAFIAGFRMPNLWSINYYLPSFFDGFYRRALAGTVLSFLGDYKFNYYAIAIIQFSILSSLIIWIFFLFKNNFLLMTLISLYFISPFGAYLFHVVGYSDQLLYLILFISIVVYKKNKALSIIIFSLSILIHEIALFITVPIYFTYVYMKTEKLKTALMYLVPSLIIFVLIYLLFQIVPTETIELFKEQIMSHANYNMRADFYTIFTSTFTGSRAQVYYKFIHLNQVFLLLSMGVLSACLMYKLTKKLIVSILIFLTGCAPLLLGILGWDIYRWFFLSFSSLNTIFILCIIHYKIDLKEFISKEKISFLYFIFYILLISTIYLEYFDGYKQREINRFSIVELKNEFLTIPTR